MARRNSSEDTENTESTEFKVDKRLVLRELIKNYRVRANTLAKRADKRLEKALEILEEEKTQ